VKLRVELRPEAVADLGEAYEWYEQQQRGLGDEFRTVVFEHLARLVTNPEIGPVVDGDAGRLLLHKFPYSLIYLTDQTGLLLIACFHASRDPAGWRARLPG
jgi:toxin ParE1/3/4